MPYSIFTRSKNKDYRWNSPPVDPLGKFIAESGVAVKRNDDDRFSVCIKSEPDPETTDFQRRPIAIALQVDGCSETKAKGLAVWALKHFENNVAELSRCVTGFGSDHWDIDASAAERFVESVPDIPSADDEWEERYQDAETEENRKRLVEQIRRYDWTKGIGLKLVVDSGFLTGENINVIRDEANQYLFKEATKRKLDDPKRPFIEEMFFVAVKRWTPEMVARSLIGIALIGMLLLIWHLHSQMIILRTESVILSKKVLENDTKLAVVKDNYRQELEKQAAGWGKILDSANQMIAEKEKEIVELKQKSTVVHVAPASDVSTKETDLTKRVTELESQRNEMVRHLNETIQGLTKIQQMIFGRMRPDDVEKFRENR